MDQGFNEDIISINEKLKFLYTFQALPFIDNNNIDKSCLKCDKRQLNR